MGSGGGDAGPFGGGGGGGDGSRGAEGGGGGAGVVEPPQGSQEVAIVGLERWAESGDDMVRKMVRRREGGLLRSVVMLIEKLNWAVV
jgi:hypothetical protein